MFHTLYTILSTMCIKTHLLKLENVVLGRKTFSYKYSMQMSCISGTMCMYEDYMRRKAEQIRKLKTFQRHLERTNRTSAATNEPDFAESSNLNNNSRASEESIKQNSSSVHAPHLDTNVSSNSAESSCKSECSESCADNDTCTQTCSKAAQKRKYDKTAMGSTTDASAQEIFKLSKTSTTGSQKLPET